MIVRNTAVALAIAAVVTALVVPAAAQEDATFLRSRLPADAVLVGPLVVHGETVAGLTISLASAQIEPDGVTASLPVQWSGPSPEGFTPELRAQATAGPSGLFHAALARVDLDLTASPDRPLVLQGFVSAAAGSSAGHRTEFRVVTPRAASAAEFLEYVQDTAMKPMDTTLRCAEPDGGEWTLRFPVRGTASVTAPDGQVLEYASVSSQSSVSMVNGEITKSYSFGLRFGDTDPVRLDVIAENTDGCGSTDGGIAGDLLDCMGGASLPVEIHAGQVKDPRDFFEEPPPPVGTCELTAVEFGFERPGR